MHFSEITHSSCWIVRMCLGIARTLSTTLSEAGRPFDRQTWRSMLRLSTNLKATEYNEDPDSPRSTQAPTAAAALQSMQPALSPGYHSNSDYRPPVVSHCIINTYTQMASRGGCTHARKFCTHTLPCQHAHSYSRANMRARWETDAHSSSQSRTSLSLLSWCLSAKCFSLFCVSSNAAFSEC